MVAIFPSSTVIPGVDIHVARMPEWDTDMQISIAGKRTAFARRAYPRYHYELTFNFLRTASAQLEFQTLLAFYNLVNGRAQLFRFTDPDDTSVTTQPFGTGDGTTTQFQLVRAMTGQGAYVFIEPVFAILTSQIFKNTVLQATPADYSISNTGV